MSRYSYLLISSLILFSCLNSGETERIFNSLEDHQALTKIKINGQNFYSIESRFNGNINLGKGFSDINIIDQFGGNIQLQMAKKNWLLEEKWHFDISPNTSMKYPNYGNMLIGKRNGTKLDGYILSRGNYEWVTLNKQRAILNLDGFVVRPQDALMPENEIPFQGTIYFKLPKIDMNDLDPKDIKEN